MTALNNAKTISVGVAATTYNAKADFKQTPSNTSVSLLNHSLIRIFNLSTTALVGVSIDGGTAAIFGDDTYHIGPRGSRDFPYNDTYSIISDTAATNVEISGNKNIQF